MAKRIDLPGAPPRANLAPPTSKHQTTALYLRPAVESVAPKKPDIIGTRSKSSTLFTTSGEGLPILTCYDPITFTIDSEQTPWLGMDGILDEPFALFAEFKP